MSYLFQNGPWDRSFQARVITEGACAGRSPRHPGVRLRLMGANESSDGSGYRAQVTLDLDLVALQQLRLELQDAERQLLEHTLLSSEVFGPEGPPRACARA